MKIMYNIAWVGALGAVGRLHINTVIIRWRDVSYSWDALAVKFIGSWLFKLLSRYLARYRVEGHKLRQFLVAKVIGGITKFSKHMLNAECLRQQFILTSVFLHIVSSVLLSMGEMLASLFLFGQLSV